MISKKKDNTDAVSQEKIEHYKQALINIVSKLFY